MRRKTIKPSILAVLLIGILIIILFVLGNDKLPMRFDGKKAYQDVLSQVAFGPRTPGSEAHTLEITFIQNQLIEAGWNFELQETSWNGFDVKNIVASRSVEQPQFIIGAHYDSRILADQDLESNHLPVPGANDGASGVAILLEIARTLPVDSPLVWLVFFDSEDNGGIGGREWIMGSKAFVNQLSFLPKGVIIVDMVGDSDLDIYQEANSDKNLSMSIWDQAEKLGYERYFIPTIKYSILDDHTPFLEAGIPAVDIIDFDYTFWHTTKDTADKVSPDSLKIVGRTIIAWIQNQK